MSGLNELLRAVLSEREAGRDVVLATVVRVEGSAYRRPGARMLVTRFGRSEGAISGGCLEADVAKKAWWLTESGPALRSYSTADEGEDGDETLSFGLGCNGVVHVLFERIPAGQSSELIDTLLKVRDSQRPAAIATVVATHVARQFAVGNRLLLTSDGALTGELLDTALADQLKLDLQSTLACGKSTLCRYLVGRHHVEVFVEFVPPLRRLVVFGAGHDVQPLVHMAKLLGWHVSVVDGRAHFARPGRFPAADRVLVGDIGQAFAYGDLVRGAAVAVMTHSLAQDAYWLEAVLQNEPCYVGQLGPRERTERLLAGIRERRGEIPGLELLHYPIGLDLGGDTSESVAIAVLAEIQAALNGRSGGSLRHRSAKIHSIEPIMVGGLGKGAVDDFAHQAKPLQAILRSDIRNSGDVLLSK